MKPSTKATLQNPTFIFDYSCRNSPMNMQRGRIYISECIVFELGPSPYSFFGGCVIDSGCSETADRMVVVLDVIGYETMETRV